MCLARSSDRSAVGPDRQHPAAPAFLDDQIQGRTSASQIRVAVSLAASTSARSTSAPVAAPPAWTTRAWEWPPSPGELPPAYLVAVEPAPRSASSRTLAGPSDTSTSTADRSQRPARVQRVDGRGGPLSRPGAGRRPHRDGEPPLLPLGPLGRRVGQGALREDSDPHPRLAFGRPRRG